MKYALHWMYINTIPPMNPIPTTINFVQNGQSKVPRLTSSNVRSISTYNDQQTHVIAIIWNTIAQSNFFRSNPDISKYSHYGKNSHYYLFVQKYFARAKIFIPQKIYFCKQTNCQHLMFLY